MVACIAASTLLGVDALPIDVEVERANGLPLISIIGLGDTAVHEARYRIQCALRATGVELSRRRTTINLAPAAIRKDGAALDLPMALGVLVAASELDGAHIEGTLAVGELALSGQLRPVRGVLPIAALARSMGMRRLIVPRENAQEAGAIDGLEILAPADLGGLLDHLNGKATLADVPEQPTRCRATQPDLRDVRGQAHGRRALEIAAAGGHNILFVGPPGSGKTMLARRLPSILPTLTAGEQIDVTRIWSAAGLLVEQHGLIEGPPFRAPHHSISEAALIGGGSTIRPGEVSLAHRGVLFLDEMPELPRRVLEGLRQPMEDRSVTIARARHVVHMPAAFMLVGAANPCPCGWRGDPSGRCVCDDVQVGRYAAKLSGALLDRIDLFVPMPAVPAQDLLGASVGEDSRSVRARVESARARARERGVGSNAGLQGEQLRAQLTPQARDGRLLREAVEGLRLSGRALERIFRVGRTISDLRGNQSVDEEAIAEALQYRQPPGWRQGAAAA